MRFTIGVLLVTSMTAVPLWAQSRPAGDSNGPREVNFVGEVLRNDVNVRSGPGETAYVCTRISSPTKVTVVDKSGDWLKIEPTAGCFSVVSKTYVTLDESNQTGTITGDNVLVHPGGDQRASGFTAMHCMLNKGAKVQVLGAIGDYYKITPPEGACFWIAARFVTPPPGEGTAEAGGAASRPAEGGVAAVTESRHHAGESTSAPAINEDEATTAFNSAERDLMAEFQKPVAQQDLDALLAKYDAIKIGPDNRLKPYVDYRISFMQAAMRDRASRKSAEENIKNTTDEVRKIDSEIAKIEVAAATQTAPSYAAQGILLASEVFPGTAASAKRYVIRDVQNRSIVAYAQSTGAVDLSKYVDKEVGIYGPKKYQRGLGFVVDAEQVVVLNEKAELPAVAKPTVTYIPPPTPAPPPAFTPRPVPVAPPPNKPTPAPAVVPPTSRPGAEIKPPASRPAAEAKPAKPSPKMEAAAQVKPAAATTKPAEAKTETITPTLKPSRAAEVKPVAPPPAPEPTIEVKLPAPATKPAEVKTETIAPVPKPSSAAEIKPVDPAPAPKATVEIKPPAPATNPAEVKTETITPAIKPLEVTEIKPAAPAPAPEATVEAKPHAPATNPAEVKAETIAPTTRPSKTAEIKPAAPAPEATVEIKTPAPTPEAHGDTIKPEPVKPEMKSEAAKPEPKPAAAPDASKADSIAPVLAVKDDAAKGEPNEPLSPSKLIEALPDNSGLPVVRPKTQPSTRPIREEEYD